MLRLEPRTGQSTTLLLLTPVPAVITTMLAGAVFFAALGKDPVEAIRIIFINPFLDPFSRSEILVKGAPLVLIAIGLSLGFRAGIWNIGAEGQYIMGGVAGSAVALAFYGTSGLWLLPLMMLGGVLGGLAWGAIPALLKTRYNANEILVSLMLVYVADSFLRAMVNGPLRNPSGFNFPESRLFHDSAVLPILIENTRVHVGVLAALMAVIVAWFLLGRHVLGYNIKLLGAAPRAVGFAGVKAKRLTIICLCTSGALTGLAGTIEVAGPFGQLVPTLPQGYGFTAIIVAFLGRLNPFGILIAGGIMALTYIGGETAQFMLQLPAAAISTFQGMLLFFLRGFDVLVKYRARRADRRPA